MQYNRSLHHKEPLIAPIAYWQYMSPNVHLCADIGIFAEKEWLLTNRIIFLWIKKGRFSGVIGKFIFEVGLCKKGICLTAVGADYTWADTWVFLSTSEDLCYKWVINYKRHAVDFLIVYHE